MAKGIFKHCYSRIARLLGAAILVTGCGSIGSSNAGRGATAGVSPVVTTTADDLAARRASSHRRFIDPPPKVEQMAGFMRTYEQARTVVPTQFVLPTSWPVPVAVIAHSAVGGVGGEGEIAVFFKGQGVDGRLVSVVSDPSVTDKEAGNRFAFLQADAVPQTPGLDVELVDVGLGNQGVLMDDGVIASIEVWKPGSGSISIETDSSPSVRGDLQRLAADVIKSSV